MRLYWILFFLFFYPARLVCQVWEDFSDGDFNNNPSWLTTTLDWKINSVLQLESMNQTANSSFSIVTGQTMAIKTVWEFYVKLQFNPSSANYVDVYLISAMPELAHSNNTGYFIRIGNTQDEVSLYRKDGNSIIKIIDGMDGVTNSSENNIRIKVVRDAFHKFMLYSDLSGTGNQYAWEGSIADSIYLSTAYFGMMIRQSTSSFFQKHKFDDISISAYVPDTIPPQLNSVTANSSQTLELNFSEPLDNNYSLLPANYLVDNNTGPPSSITLAGPLKLKLSFNGNFDNDITYNILVQNLRDLSGNIMPATNRTFEFYTAKQFDVLIHEVMADPSPPIGLPNAEFVELKNRSGKNILLEGWKLGYNSTLSGEFPSFLLMSDSILILTNSSNLQLFEGYGQTIGLPLFPVLSNAGGTLHLRSKEGKTIHGMEYSDQWHENALKKEGGWTLEMADINQPCMGKKNWKASMAPPGGTPGKENSVKKLITDESSPSISRAFSTDSLTVIAVFDEPIDSLTGSSLTSYEISKGIIITQATPISPLFNRVRLNLGIPLQPSEIYSLSVKNLVDCNNNSIGINNTVKLGLSSKPSNKDIVINEVLFNPRPNGNDFVEIKNTGNAVADLSQINLAGRNSSNTITSIIKLSDEPYFLYPGEYAVFTEDPENLSIQYHIKFPETCFKRSLPSLADDEGSVLLLNDQGIILDELNYSEDWHFALIKEREGVSLERIDPKDSTNNKNNWQSAASTAGYGTPGYINSQSRPLEQMIAAIEALPKVFSPDLDGHDDFVQLKFQVEESGYVMNSTVFDASGRPVRLLVRNNLLGLKGSFIWDGLNDKKEKLPAGSYIIFTEIFNLNGKKQKFKNVVALARNY